jgi:hypothetical protein
MDEIEHPYGIRLEICRIVGDVNGMLNLGMAARDAGPSAWRSAPPAPRVVDHVNRACSGFAFLA